jgi:uncharacterized protein (DUF4415 family)
MAKGFFSRFSRSGGSDPLKTPPEEPTPPAANPPPAIAEIAREIARQGLPPASRKAAISLRLDEDVLEWFKAQGPGYQTRINAVLRAYRNAAG